MKDLIYKILKEDRKYSEFSGWVNVKIDSELDLRIARLMKGLGFRGGDIRNKIKFLSDPVHGRIRQGESIGQALNRKISAMMLLQYLKELKTLFNSSSAGFLFESFIAGLLDGEQIPGKGAVDVKTPTEKYQIKFYTSGAIKRPKALDDVPTKIILGVKNPDSVTIYQMNYDLFLTNTNENDSINFKNFKKLAEENDGKLGTLDLSNIEGMSDQLQEDLSSSISSLWGVISELQFNVESMLTGISKEGEKTTTLKAANAAQNNARELDSKIEEVRGFFKPKTLA